MDSKTNKNLTELEVLELVVDLTRASIELKKEIQHIKDRITHIENNNNISFSEIEKLTTSIDGLTSLINNYDKRLEKIIEYQNSPKYKNIMNILSIILILVVIITCVQGFSLIFG